MKKCFLMKCIMVLITPFVLVLTSCTEKQGDLHVYLSMKDMEVAISKAHGIMNEKKSDPLVWDDANNFTNVVLDIGGSADDININLLLADADLSRSGETRYQRFKYDYVNNSVEINYALGAVVLDTAKGSENTIPAQNNRLAETSEQGSKR